MESWDYAFASVKGISHHKTGTPCQDSCSVKTDRTGDWIAIAVSDGAGTAPKAHEGSQFVVNKFIENLIELPTLLEKSPPGNWVNDYVIETVLTVRKSLRELSGSDNIKDFNCTLVACLIGPYGGFSIHIGDGVIFGGSIDSSNNNLPKNESYFISKPENGEYSNETFFITESDWIKHLRIVPIPPIDWLYVCTDGGGALAITDKNSPKLGFVLPVIKEVLSVRSSQDRNKKIHQILEDPQADKITDDDKTIVLACRRLSAEKLASISKEQFSFLYGTDEIKVSLDTSIKRPTENNNKKEINNLSKEPNSKNSIDRNKNNHRIILLILFLTIAIGICSVYFLRINGYSIFSQKNKPSVTKKNGGSVSGITDNYLPGGTISVDTAPRVEVGVLSVENNASNKISSSSSAPTTPSTEKK